MRYMRLLAGICLFGMLVGNAHARGLLGQRFVSVGGGVTFINDDPAQQFDDTTTEWAGSLNLPACEYADVGVVAGYSELDGDNHGINLKAHAASYGAGIIVHPKIADPLTPFATLSGAYVDTETKVRVDGGDAAKDTNDDEVYNVGVGVQWDLGHDFALLPEAALQDFGDAKTFAIGVTLNKWLTKNVGIDASVSRDFDQGDVGVHGDLNVAF